MDDLVDYIERCMKEFADKTGLQLTEPADEKTGKRPVTGTITFLKGNSAKKPQQSTRRKINSCVP